MSADDVVMNDLEISVEDFKASVLSNKKIVANPAGGDCLFHALSYLMKKQFPEKKASISSKNIRKDICEYYEKTFRGEKSISKALVDLSKGSEIEKSLFFFYTFGAQPDSAGNFTIADFYLQHQREVCKKTVWGEDADLIVAAIIYDINIVVFSLYPPTDDKPATYHMLTYKNKEDRPTFYLHLKMEGSGSHYEAMSDKSRHDKTEKAKDTSSEKRKTRKVKKQIESESKSLLEKVTRFYEKIEKFIPSEKKTDILSDFSDIQTDIVTMITGLDILLLSASSEQFSESAQIDKKTEELASLRVMVPLVSESERADLLKRIAVLESEIKK
jgi:hypothetical protein